MAYSTINDPSAYFQTKLFTGNGSTQSITNDGNSNLRPDWIWVKDRGSAFDHKLSDSERGSTYTLESNTDIAEYNDTNAVTSFNTDGFSLGNNANVNDNTANVVAWQWAAGGAAPTQTYRVVVVSDSGNKYRWRNSTNSATFAQSAVTLDLQEGGTYTIDGSDSSVASHPIKLSTTADGTHGGGSSYNTGVVYKLDGSTVTESAYVSGYASASSRQLVITVAASAPTLYYYCHYHSGMGGQINTNATFGQSNFNGSVQSLESVNTTSKFSIVRYTGTGSAITVGHDLGSVPKTMWFKRLDSAENWRIYHWGGYVGNSYGQAQAGGKLNSTGPFDFGANSPFNNTLPTSSVFTVNVSTEVNASSGQYIAFLWDNVQGFQKFGQYTGNNNAVGPHIYTGFKPKMVMIKSTSASAENWTILNSTADPFNYQVQKVNANNTAAGSRDSNSMDFLSNGFKLRAAIGNWNASHQYVYWAWAEAPLVASNDVIGTAG